MKTNKLKLIGANLAVIVGLALPATGVLAASTQTNIKGTIGSFITVASSGDVNINVTPSDPGTVTSTANNVVTVNTNNSSGYNLKLDMVDDVRNLVKTGGTIAPSAGTMTNAADVAANTWGYRVDGVGGASGFGDGPTTALNSETATLKFAGVPAHGSPDTIKTTDSVTSGSGDTTTVWYMVSADSSLPTGDYTGIVVYTATPNP